jgi:hypothetical protein
MLPSLLTRRFGAILQFQKIKCGMIAPADHFRREPYLRKRVRVRAWTLFTPRAGTFVRACRTDMIGN